MPLERGGDSCGKDPVGDRPADEIRVVVLAACEALGRETPFIRGEELSHQLDDQL